VSASFAPATCILEEKGVRGGDRSWHNDGRHDNARRGKNGEARHHRRRGKIATQTGLRKARWSARARKRSAAHRRRRKEAAVRVEGNLG
jgi:hypothetical protein